jgi:hypothetical protein
MTLLAFERRWAEALLAAFAPAGTGLHPHPGERIDFAGAFRSIAGRATRRAALGFRLGLWLAALAPLWHWRRFATVSRLPSPRRTELLRSLLAHRSFVVRELTLLLKMVASFALLAHPGVRSRSGYDEGVRSPWPLHPADEEVAESGTRRKRLPVVSEARDTDDSKSVDAG